MAITEPRNPRASAFAARLREALAEKGVSRRELARRISAAEGISFETARTNVHRMLRADHAPTETTRHIVADALDLDRSEFEEAALSGDSFREPRGRSTADGRAGRRESDGADVTEDAA